MINIIKSLINRGFIHIVLSSSLVKVVSFISAIFLPRIITSKSDYGLLVYAENIINYLLLFNAFGLTYSTFLFCSRSQNIQEQKKYLIGTLSLGLIIDLVIFFIALVVFSMLSFPIQGAKTLLIMMAAMPLFVFVIENIQFFFRATFDNKRFSQLSFIYTLLIVTFQISFAVMWDVKGVVLGRYLGAVLTIIIAAFLLSRIHFFKNKVSLPDFGELKRMLKYGITMSLTNAASLMMLLNEVFIIGYLLKNTQLLADYKVASYILTISLFVTQSIALFVTPYFSKHSADKQWVYKTFKKLSLYNALGMIPLHIGLIIFAKSFLIIIFGAQYSSAAFIMQMLLIASLFQSIFRMLPGNILSVIGYEYYNLRLNIFFLITHVIIDLLAISYFGIMGAALGLIFVYASSGIILTLKIRKVTKVTLA